MDEHHFDALPPVDPSLTPQAQEPVPEVAMPNPEEIDAAKALEQAPAGGFVDPAAAMTPPPPAALPPIDEPSTAANTATPPPPSATPAIADDADLIEKEWVMKAKQIVEKTKDDPHRQNEEINKVKADYLKKRYNHDLKVGN